MGLVCNDRTAACVALAGIEDLPLPNQQRLARMRGRIPNIEIQDQLELGPEWQQIRERIEAFKKSYAA